MTQFLAIVNCKERMRITSFFFFGKKIPALSDLPQGGHSHEKSKLIKNFFQGKTKGERVR